MKSFTLILSLMLLLGMSGILKADYYCITGSSDNTVKLWNITKSSCLKTYSGHTDNVNAVLSTPDDAYFFSGSSDNTVKYWQISTGTVIRTFTGHTDAVTSLSMTNNMKNVISGSEDATIKVWNIATGALVRTINNGQAVYALSIITNKQNFVSGAADDTLRLWNLETGACEHKFVGHTDYIMAAALSHNNQFALSGSRDNTIKLWDVQTGALLRTMQAGEWVSFLTFSKDGKLAISGLSDLSNNVKVWRMSDGVLLRTINAHSQWVTSVLFSPDELYILSTARDNLTKVWSVSDGTLFKTLTGHSDWVNSVTNCLGTTGFSFDMSSATLPRKSMSATPNPFTTSLTLVLPSSAQVYSLTGQLIMTVNEGNQTLNTSSWDKGIYIIKCGSDSKRIVKID
jgi:WD40 repeat protein